MNPDERLFRRCPVCLSGQNQKLITNQMMLIDVYDMSYDIVCCKDCGFVFASNMSTEAAYEKYYENLSKYDVIDRLEQIPFVDQKRAATAVEMCAKHLSRRSTIVDLGCGVGILLNLFKKNGWKSLYGVDPAPNAGKCAKALFGLEDIISGTLSSFKGQLSAKDLNLVCLTGVLEHLTSPRREMGELVEWLEPDTLILIEVPALERFNVEPNEPNGEFSIEHLQFFSKTSLINFMHCLGTELIVLDYLDLAPAATDSLLGLFKVRQCSRYPEQKYTNTTKDRDIITDYIARSGVKLEKAVKRIKEIEGDCILYGAGSHTTRLMSALDVSDLSNKISFIVDKNRNLHGKYLGGKKILNPDTLVDQPTLPIVVSSFRAQTAIANFVEEHFENRIITLY